MPIKWSVGASEALWERIRSTSDNPPKNALNQRYSGAARRSMRRLNHAVIPQRSKSVRAEPAEFAQDALGIGS
jgi:hypothetical protein